MSTSTRVLCLLPALWPAITLGEPSAPAGQSCPAPSGKSTVPAQMASIPPGEKPLSLILEAWDNDGKPISDQKEIMEWIRLRLALAGTQPDSIAILPEGGHGVRVQLRGEAMQQADNLESYLCHPGPFRILPVHPDNDVLLATGIVRNMPGNARIMLQTNPNGKLASEIIVQTDMEPERRFIRQLHSHESPILKITTQPDIYGNNITIITLCHIHRCWSPPPIVLCPFPELCLFPNEPEINWIVPNSPFPHDTRTEYDPLTEPRLPMHDAYAEDFIITRHNIAKACVDQQDPTRILITLTPAGRLKLQQYKDLMNPAVTRLAFVMDNRIIATPNLPGNPDKELSFALNTPQQTAQTAQWLSSKNIHLVRVDHQKNSQPTSTAE